MSAIPSRLQISLLSKDRETLRTLSAYLERTGIRAHAETDLDAPELVRPKSAALVIFPDDFDPAAMLEALQRLRRERRGLLFILVTAEPRRFEAFVRASPAGRAPVVLAKPVWGWALLDVILGHADAQS